MTVAQLIAELQQYPSHLPVRVCLSEVITDGAGVICLEPDCDSMEADRVIHEGNHILIESA